MERDRDAKGGGTVAAKPSTLVLGSEGGSGAAAVGFGTVRGTLLYPFSLFPYFSNSMPLDGKYPGCILFTEEQLFMKKRSSPKWLFFLRKINCSGSKNRPR